MKNSEIEKLYELLKLKESLEHNVEVLKICEIDYDVTIMFKPNTENYSGGKKMSMNTYWNKWEKPLAQKLYTAAIEFYSQKHDETMKLINEYGRINSDENVENKI